LNTRHRTRSWADDDMQVDAQTARLTKKAKEDLVKDSQSNIKNLGSAKKWLIDNRHVIEGEPATIGSMATALLQISSGSTLVVRDMINGIRAVAIYMEELGKEEQAKEAVQMIKGQVDGMMDEIKGKIGALTENLAQKMAGGIATGESGERRGRLEEEEITRIVEKVVETAKKKPTYAEALGRKDNPGTANREEQIRQDVLMRDELQQRQFILDGDEGLANEKLTPKEMIVKANLAIDQVAAEEEDSIYADGKPQGTRFVAARPLKNGGILLEMETEEGVEWLREESIKERFESSFPGLVKVKERTYQVVVQFISTRLKEKLEKMLTEIEDENSFPEDTILKARWMRNPTNWSQTQLKAHAVVSVPSKGIANMILRKGLIIEGIRHEARKLEEDPKRCFRCQLIGAGHMAATCTASEACSNCSGHHATGECRANRAEFRCVTCKKNKQQDDHASWDRRCPAFLQEKARLREKKPENYYRYYPSARDPTTWVTHEESFAGREAERWMGNENRPLHNAARAAQRDDGWGKSLGTGFRKGTDTWRPRPVDSYVPRAADSYAPKPTQGERNGNNQTSGAQERRGEANRSKSRGRATQRTEEREREPRQQSLVDYWKRNRSREQRERRNEETRGGEQQRENRCTNPTNERK